jgi:hypothetical protein
MIISKPVVLAIGNNYSNNLTCRKIQQHHGGANREHSLKFFIKLHEILID